MLDFYNGFDDRKFRLVPSPIAIILLLSCLILLVSISSISPCLHKNVSADDT